MTKVVADWGCVGFLAPNDPVFNDRFQAAYAVEVLRLKGKPMWHPIRTASEFFLDRGLLKVYLS